MLALSSSLRLGNMWRERNMWHHNERVGRRSGRVRKRIEGDYGGGEGKKNYPTDDPWFILRTKPSIALVFFKTDRYSLC